MPNSDTLPTPQGLPTTSGCMWPAGAPHIGVTAECKVYGLPPAATITLTANSQGVFLRIGSVRVFPDGTWYFPWIEYSPTTVVFVVSAGGVSRSFSVVFAAS